MSHAKWSRLKVRCSGATCRLQGSSLSWDVTQWVAEHRPEDVDGNASSAIQSYTNQDLLNLLSLLERCKASSLFRLPKGVAVLHFSFTRLENAARPCQTYRRSSADARATVGCMTFWGMGCRMHRSRGPQCEQSNETKRMAASRVADPVIIPPAHHHQSWWDLQVPCHTNP